jgi:hypothetical protein
MKLLAWACFTAWCVLLVAATGLAARVVPLPNSHLGLAAFTPDLATLFLVTACARLERGDARLAAFVVAAVRAAFGADSPLALLAAAWATAEVCAFVRTQLDVEGRFVRATLAGVVAALHASLVWFAAVRRAPVPARLERDVFDYALPALLGTAVAALVLGGLLTRLFGLTPLWRKEETWALAAPAR